jgi:hypothetical protein
MAKTKTTTRMTKHFEATKMGKNPATERMQFTVGKTMEMGVFSTWASVFDANESHPKKKKLTDEQIAAFMIAEFPKHDTKLFKLLKAGVMHRVQAMRASYNRGQFTKGVKPKKVSHRYDKSGNVCDPIFSGKKGVTMDQILPEAKAKSKKKSDSRNTPSVVAVGKKRRPRPKTEEPKATGLREMLQF